MENTKVGVMPFNEPVKEMVITIDFMFPGQSTCMAEKNSSVDLDSCYFQR